MRTLLVIAAIAIAVSIGGQAHAGWVGSQVGNYSYWSNTQTGQTTVCSRVGNYTYCN
jgi:hypothetical protein